MTDKHMYMPNRAINYMSLMSELSSTYSNKWDRAIQPLQKFVNKNEKRYHRIVQDFRSLIKICSHCLRMSKLQDSEGMAIMSNNYFTFLVINNLNNEGTRQNNELFFIASSINIIFVKSIHSKFGIILHKLVEPRAYLYTFVVPTAKHLQVFSRKIFRIYNVKNRQYIWNKNRTH